MNEISGQDKPPQKCFAHYVIQMALDQINALSDSLIAIQSSKYQVEKNTIASLAFLIREKTQNIQNFMEEMEKENRAIVLGEPLAPGMEEVPASMAEPGTKNLLFATMMRWYEKEAKKE